MKLPESVKGLLRTFAPTVVAALTGPFAPLAAGLVTAALKQWLPEGTERATPAQIVQAVDANLGNAALLTDLKAAEKALTDTEKELGFRFAELEQKDRSDARAFVRDSGLARSQFIAGMLLVGIALFMLFGVIVGCVLAVTGIINVDPAQSQVTIAAFGLVGTIVGIMQGLGANIVGFYWGSSAGSALKNERIGDTMRELGEALSDRVRTQPLPAPPPPVPAPVVVAPLPPVPVPPLPKPLPPAGKPSRFVTVIDDLFESEGGYVDNPKDPGGCTNLGITIGTLKDWRGESVTCDEVRALTREEASKIYFAKYWNALSCDSLPPGLDYLVFDFGVNAGVSRSARTLQTILARNDMDVRVDGVIGPLTLAAVAKLPAHTLIEEFHAERMRFYQNLSTWDTFGKGWARRSSKVLTAARADASASVAT